jgi:hypothetical protein
MLPDKVRSRLRRFDLLAVLDHPWVTRVSTVVTFAGVAVGMWKFFANQLHGADAWTFLILAMITLGGGVNVASLVVRRRHGRGASRVGGAAGLREEPSAPFVMGPSPWPRSPLVRVVIEQLVAARQIERERPVRGDGWYFDAVVEWAGDTSVRLRGVKAGNLTVEFEQDGIHAPLTVERIGDYMAEKMQLLRDTLAQLRSDEFPAVAVDRVALLREVYKRGKGMQARIAYSGNEQRHREAACEWAKEAWEVVAEHFPAHGQGFYGPHSDVFRGPLFDLSCREEMDALGYVDAYVEKKLDMLGELLQTYDVPGQNRP